MCACACTRTYAFKTKSLFALGGQGGAFERIFTPGGGARERTLTPGGAGGFGGRFVVALLLLLLLLLLDIIFLLIIGTPGGGLDLAARAW
jgi:hypothetical protein